jgi:hypothetical protein
MLDFEVLRASVGGSAGRSRHHDHGLLRRQYQEEAARSPSALDPTVWS